MVCLIAPQVNFSQKSGSSFAAGALAVLIAVDAFAARILVASLPAKVVALKVQVVLLVKPLDSR